MTTQAPTSTISKTAEAVILAGELVAELEDDSGPTQRLMRRARRLFTALDDASAVWTLDCELVGYPNDAQLPAVRTQLATALSDPWIAYASLPEIESRLEKIGEELAVAAREDREDPSFSYWRKRNQAGLRDRAAGYSNLRHTVRDWLHRRVTQAYLQLRFGDAAQAIFEEHRARVDALLKDAAPDAIASLRSVNTRVLEGDAEAMSQALNSCRRLIYALADKLVAPTSTPVVVDGKSYDLGSDKYLNRIYEHMRTCGKSKSRRDHIDTVLKTLHDRLSTGLKVGVSADEGRSLVLTTYLVLGEVLLEAPPATAR
jgi:hypothetical protein